MRILLVLGRYLPLKSGGIENYTNFLATLLSKNNCETDISILNNESTDPYMFDQIRVIPLKNGLESFINLLKKKSYDICHFQEYSGGNGINIKWFTTARRFCKKVFFTFHLPYLTCYKNDFRYLGIEDCNIFSSPERCVECIIATKMNYKKSSGWNLHNTAIHLITPLIKRTGKINELRKRIQLRNKELEEVFATCDNLFIYGAWFKKILIENGYDSPKIKLIPHITKPDFTRKQREKSIKKKILFVGRVEPEKGLHLLVRAMNKILTQNIQLDVVGNMVDEEYFKASKERYPFNYKGVLPRTTLLQSFPEYDFLILPSVFTEMYSLVVREAFYEHLPVIASAAKGNVEVIKEGKNGFIFEYDNYKDLAHVIDKAYNLNENGWQPEFETNSFPDRDIEEILSYYVV